MKISFELFLNIPEKVVAFYYEIIILT